MTQAEKKVLFDLYRVQRDKYRAAKGQKRATYRTRAAILNTLIHKLGLDNEFHARKGE